MTTKLQFFTAKFGISTFRGAAKFRFFYRERFLPLAGAFVCRGGVEIAKFAIFRDKSRNRRFSAKNREIDNFPRQIAI